MEAAIRTPQQGIKDKGYSYRSRTFLTLEESLKTQKNCIKEALSFGISKEEYISLFSEGYKSVQSWRVVKK